MRAIRLQIFLSIVIFALCSPLHAIVVDNLYTVIIQVTDNTLATRNKHLPKAFEQVIKKVASSQHVLEQPEYHAAAMHLDRFVSQYFFKENNGEYLLTLHFNEQMINRLIQKIGRTTLGKNRPQVLLWMVVEQNDQLSFVTYGPHDELAQRIDLLAKDYGVPIILPLVDLTERVFISENDVINFNLPPLQQVSARYSTSTLLLGKAKNINGAWHCEWHLVDGDYNASWTATSMHLDQELDGMVNSLADQLVTQQKATHERATQFAKQSITIRVKGIKSANDYTKALEGLKNLTAAQNVELGAVDGNQATFIVTAEDGMAGIAKSLQWNELFITDASEVFDPSQNTLDITFKAIS